MPHQPYPATSYQKRRYALKSLKEDESIIASRQRKSGGGAGKKRLNKRMYDHIGNDCVETDQTEVRTGGGRKVIQNGIMKLGIETNGGSRYTMTGP
jgi:hypothetical protein